MDQHEKTMATHSKRMSVPPIGMFFFFALYLIPCHSADAGVCDRFHTADCSPLRTINSPLANSFSINPAWLPTQESPMGLETIYSMISMHPWLGNLDLSIIKGFNKIGAGVATASENTFYANDVIQRATGPSKLTTFNPHETPQGHLTDLNTGVSFDIGGGENKKGDSIGTELGFSARYNHVTDTVGGGPGILFNWHKLSWGGGITKEKVATNLENVTFFTGEVAVNTYPLEFAYDILMNHGGYALGPVHIFTLTASAGKLTLTYAVRFLTYTREGYISQSHVAVQYFISKHLSGGLLYNYIPGSGSLAMQFYL
jgi:hypothetical protein